MSKKELELLKRATKLFPILIDSYCGNCEDTPCDDLRPSYVCQEHRWLKEVRELLVKRRKETR